MNQLTIPNKLYGRERDIITLLESFERISGGYGEILLVPGSSGVGKTALVQELQKPIRDRNGFFIRGKFDQYQQNIPYFGFRQALTELCRQLQSGDSLQLSRFKTRILQAIGNLGQVLVDLAPEFESFLGVQLPLVDISPQEARHRLADFFRNFLNVICKPEHPLVLFIDDWQWADAASLELLKQIQVGTTLRYLLVIVSYRDNEVDSGHPLLSMVDDIRCHAVPVEVLQIKNITAHDVREIVADTLKPAIEGIEGLATIIHEKTLGNPFFVRSFFSFLHEFNLVWFDNTRNYWQWRTDKINGVNMPDNVVDLFVQKLRTLDRDSQNLFSLAACLGNRFDLDTLSIISGRSSKECLSLLFSAQARTLLLPFNGDKYNNPAENSSLPKTCIFLHDRVQQAAYTLIEPAELPDILLKIGRLLLASLHPEQLNERLFEVMNHLNAGYNLILDTSEQLKVVELNISAARKAYADAAYRSALQFYRAANRFLEKPDLAELLWSDHHELIMSLIKERAGCEFLEGNRTEAENCVQQAVTHSRSALEKADAFNILIVQYTLLARYPEAITAGRQALDALGISLPKENYDEARNDEIALVRQELGNRSISSLIELPVMSNPEMLMSSKIMITMGPPCYRSHQRLWSVLVPKVVNLTLRYGNIPQVGYSHTAFGGLLGWVDNDYATAKEFEELATRLMTGTFRSPTDQSVFYLMIGSSIRHWFKHLMYATQDYKDAYDIGLRSGNLQYAAYAFGHNMYCQFYQGVPLTGLIQESRRSLEFSRTRLNQWAIDLLAGGLNIFGALSAESHPLNDSEVWSEKEFLQRVEDHHNIQVTCIYKVLKTFSLLVSGNNDAALLLSDEAEQLIYTVGTQGLLPWPEHVFARLLILTALYSKTEEKQQLKWRPELEQMIGRLRIWADNCPENFEHKYLLAAAELARIDGRPIEAIPLYDLAVEAAQAGGFLQWEGMANERAYSYWLECGNGRLAQVYWQQAYVCYDRWGAVAKVQAMESAYRTYLANYLPMDDASKKPTAKLVLEIKNDLVERQINKLRNVTLQMQQAGLRIEAVNQSRELADAMQRLRVEIAEHKRTEEALRESEERFKKLFIDAPLGIALIDSLTGNIFEVNPMFAKIAGRTVAEMAQIDWMRITHPDDIQEDLDNMALLNAGEINGFQMEKRYLHPDGTVVWINMTIAKVKVEDKIHPHHLCMIEDITRRKKAEEEKLVLEHQLQRSQKLESLGVLAGGIAHDFNNILGVIIGHCGLLKLRPEKVKDNIPEIEKAAERAAELCRQMLAYAGKSQSVITQVEMTTLVADMVRMLKATIPQNAVIKPELSADIPSIKGDSEQLRQIVMNLILNAAEAIGETQGEIRVSLTKIEIRGGNSLKDHLGKIIPNGMYVCLVVTDSGCGMDDEIRSKIFEPFYTTKFFGRGLGMSATLGIVTAHKGALQLLSQPGQGTTFMVYLPVQVSDSAKDLLPSQVAPAQGLGNGTILLAEDEEQLRMLAEEMLEMLGFKVLSAANGREALELLTANAADITLVITDMGMPVMDGYELVRELKKLNPELPIIISSGFGNADVTSRVACEDIAGLISKPYKFEQLREVLKSVVENSLL